MEPCCVLQAFLDFVSFVGSEVPVTIFTGKPQLGVAKLRSYHEPAKTRFMGSFAGCAFAKATEAARAIVALTISFIRRPPELSRADLVLTTAAALGPIFTSAPQAMRWQNGRSKHRRQWLACGNAIPRYVFPKTCWALYRHTRDSSRYEEGLSSLSGA